MRAAWFGHMQLVSVLLEFNADINRQSENGISPLLGAVGNGHAEVVAVLLHRNADVALEDKTGTNALDRVVTINRPDLEAQLKEATGIPGLTEQERQTWASEQKAKRAADCRSSKTKKTRGCDASHGSKQTKIRQPTRENTSESPGKLVFSADRLFGPFHQLQLPVNMNRAKE